MIPKECKRLAEVDFPIAVVSRHSAREKSIRHGHPSTLHLWWARRPLAACRAMLMALLLPDPCDPKCPAEFLLAARDILLKKSGRPIGWKSEVSTSEGLRKTLLEFIGDLANWDNSANSDYLVAARALVKAAHPDETPLVVDPFSGGGSIPLEALRLGCEVFASDLNPVACLILKVMLEDIPRHGPELADELRQVGSEIKNRAEEEMAEFYPKDADGATPIAYLWARTVKCESPDCGAEIPLMRSFWLCRKASRKRALSYEVLRPDGGPPQVDFGIFEPKVDKDVHGGTVTRARATCLCCGTVLPPERVRVQLAEQSGGADVFFDAKGSRIGGARMLAVVTLHSGIKRREYRPPTEHDYQSVWMAQKRIRAMLDEWERGGKKGLCPIPDEPLPPIGTLGFRVQRYGMLRWGDLFTARQKVTLVTMQKSLELTCAKDQLRTLAAMAITRFSDDFSSLVRWMDRETPSATFTRHALPILWDFCETFPFDNASWSFPGSFEWVASSVDGLSQRSIGQVQQADAAESPLPDAAASVWFTDPPYYDAIPYSDLSDFFLVWLKRMLPGNPLLRDPFDHTNRLSPKEREAVQDEARLVNGRPKDRKFFEDRMAEAFAESRRYLRDEGVGSVVFAHKTTEGWEALLSGIIQGGWVITGSWPIATERKGRPRSQDSAALATSVHLVCRPRPDDTPVGDWADVLHELPNRVGDWMERLQSEGVRGADLVFACIGPALEIFSRYRKVETAAGRVVTLTEYLEKVWEVVGREALCQVLGTDSPGDFGEDARLTALFLWTLRTANGQNGDDEKHIPDDQGVDNTLTNNDEDDSTVHNTHLRKGYVLPFDIVRRIAQPLGIHLDRWNRRLIDIDKGVVRLLPLALRSEFLVEPGVAHDLVLLDSGRHAKSKKQMLLFEEPAEAESRATASAAHGRIERETWSQLHLDSITTLDHVHKAMLLQKQGHTNALRELLFYEKHYRPEFVRLANALSALYPSGSEEKRLLDAMLLAVPK